MNVEEGWRFRSADFSMQASGWSGAKGTVMFIRSPEQCDIWYSLEDEVKDSDDCPALYVVGQGNTIEEAFVNSALALKDTISGDIKVKEIIEKKIEIKEIDFKSLLYNFLEEFLYFLDAEDFLISRIKKLEIDKKNLKLNAVVLGDRASSYDFVNDVKAITYNDMFVKQEDNEWVLQIVLDV